MSSPRKSPNHFRSLTILPVAAILAGLSFVVPQHAHAATYYWDNNGSAAGFGNASGTWAAPTTGNATQGWSTSATGALLPGNVTTTTSDTVNFGNGTTGLGSGTITVSGTVNTGNMTFAAGSGPINLSGGTISLGGGRIISATSTDHAINSNIILNGASTISFSRNTSAPGSFTIGGQMSGTGGVTFTTPNVVSGNHQQTIVLTEANTYTGNTTITTGNINNTMRVQAGIANALPTGTVLTLDGGNGAGTGRTTAYNLNGFNQTLAGLTNNTTRTLRNQRVTNTGALATLTIDNSANFSYGGSFAGTTVTTAQIVGAIALTKEGTGRFTLLAGAGNTYTGITTINGGALQIQHANSLGSTAAGTVVNGNTSGAAGNARLELAGGIAVNAGESVLINGNGNFLGALTSTSGDNIWQGGVTIGSVGTRIGASAGSSLEVSGVIDSGAVNTGLIIRTADLTSSVILSGANTYLGNTEVIVGKLQLGGGNNRLPVGTNVILGAGVNVTEFDLNGRNQEIAGLSLAAGATAASNSVNNSSASLSTLTVNTAAPSTFGGIVKGNLALTKTGNDTLTLTGVNTYTGTTAVNGGTLELRETYATPTFNIASGAVLELNTGAANKAYATTTFSGAGTLRKTGTAQALWQTSSATFAMASGSLIDVQEGTFVGGSNANEVWTNNRSDLNVAAGALFRGVEANVRIDALTGAGTVATGHGHASYQNFTIGVDNGSGTFSGTIEDVSAPGNLVKVGTGTQTFTGANTYTGTTAVNDGTLLVHGTHTGGGLYTVNSVGTLGGNGTIDAAVNLFGTISPGASIGTFNTGSETWNNGGNFLFEIDNATGTAGATGGPGWDLLAVTGMLDLSGLSPGGFTIDIVSLQSGGGTTPGLIDNFTGGQQYLWEFVTTTGGVIGFDANLFTLNDSGFANPFGGSFAVLQTSSGLALAYVPEPGAYALGLLGAVGVVLLLWRRKRL